MKKKEKIKQFFSGWWLFISISMIILINTLSLLSHDLYWQLYSKEHIIIDFIVRGLVIVLLALIGIYCARIKNKTQVMRAESDIYKRKVEHKIQTNTIDPDVYKTKVDEYNAFRAKVRLCSRNGMKYVCIHSENKELYYFTEELVQIAIGREARFFVKLPSKITTYSDLLENLSKEAITFYSDLNESNWMNYFEFLFFNPDHDGDVLKKQLLSQDESVVITAAFAVSDYVLKAPVKRKELLAPSYQCIDLIENNAENLNMGGLFASNKRFLFRAIEIIKGNNSNKCFCRTIIDEFGTSANGLAKKGFVLIQADKKIDDYSCKGIIECPICHKRYSIIEEYTGWHIPTRIHCTEIIPGDNVTI